MAIPATQAGTRHPGLGRENGYAPVFSMKTSANGHLLVKVKPQLGYDLGENNIQERLGDRYREIGLAVRSILALVNQIIPSLLDFADFLPESLRRIGSFILHEINAAKLSQNCGKQLLEAVHSCVLRGQLCNK